MGDHLGKMLCCNQTGMEVIHLASHIYNHLYNNPSYSRILIDHFTVVCLVAWPLNDSEAGVDLVLIETSLLFTCKFLLISMRTASLT